MTGRAELRGMVALLVAGALALHVFVLSHGHADVAGTPVAVAADRAAHGHDREAAGDGTAASCYSVLVGAVGAVAALVRPRSPGRRSAGAARAAPGAPPPSARAGAGARDGPRWALPVIAGVLLRV